MRKGELVGKGTGVVTRQRDGYSNIGLIERKPLAQPNWGGGGEKWGGEEERRDGEMVGKWCCDKREVVAVTYWTNRT